MAKRFIETTIWTQNQWFRKLPTPVKLFWFYVISNCDSVGVWEEDFELASFIIGNELCKEEVYAHLDGKIKIISSKKIWIKDFCSFQYGELKEEATANKPHQSYIALLKKHSLWIDYQYSIDRDKEKENDIEKEKIPVKEMGKDIEEEIDTLGGSLPF